MTKPTKIQPALPSYRQLQEFGKRQQPPRHSPRRPAPPSVIGRNIAAGAVILVAVSALGGYLLAPGARPEPMPAVVAVSPPTTQGHIFSLADIETYLGSNQDAFSVEGLSPLTSGELSASKTPAYEATTPQKEARPPGKAIVARKAKKKVAIANLTAADLAAKFPIIETERFIEPRAATETGEEVESLAAGPSGNIKTGRPPERTAAAGSINLPLIIIKRPDPKGGKTHE